MATLVDVDSSAYATYLSDKADKLACWEIAPEYAVENHAFTTLRNALKSRFNFEALEGADPNEIAELVCEEYNKLKADPTYSELFNALSVSANKFGTKIARVMNVLSNDVYPEMMSLKQKIYASQNELLAKAGLEEYSIDNTDPKFNVMDWDATLNLLGGSEVINEKFAAVNGFEGRHSENDLREALGSDAYKVHTLKLDTEDQTKILQRMKEKLGKGDEYAPQVQKFYELVTDSYMFRGFTDRLLHATPNSTDIANILQESKFFLEDNLTILKMMQARSFNISDKAREILAHNLSAMENCMYLLGYEIDMFRDHYQNALVIDRNLLNGDTYKDFANKSGRLQDIQDYLTVAFKNDEKVPLHGIKAEVILDSRENVHKQLEENKIQLKRNLNKVHDQTLVESARNVLRDYVLTLDNDLIPEGIKREQYIQSLLPIVEAKLHKIDSNADNNLESVIYEFLMDLTYDGTIVPKVHKMLGESVTKAIANKPELSSDDIAVATGEVVYKLAADYFGNL